MPTGHTLSNNTLAKVTVTSDRPRSKAHDEELNSISPGEDSPELNVTFLWEFDPAVKTLPPLPAIFPMKRGPLSFS